MLTSRSLTTTPVNGTLPLLLAVAVYVSSSPSVTSSVSSASVCFGAPNSSVNSGPAVSLSVILTVTVPVNDP